MKICMVSIDSLPQVGGIANHIANLVRSLESLGHEAVVVRPLAGARAETRLAEYDGIRTVDAYFKAGPRLIEIVRRSVITVRGIRHARRLMNGLDVIHQHDYVASSPACGVIRAPYVFTNHSSHFLKEISSARGRLHARAGQRGMQVIIAPSPELAERSRAIWGRRLPVRYVPNGVDPAVFDLAVANQQTTRVDILCPRRMDPKNGIIYLVQAYLDLCVQSEVADDTRLLVTGAADTAEHRAYEADVRGIVEASEFGSRVKFLGNIAASDMPALYKSASIVCIPSLVEAVSLAALEGMASGLPVIASDVGGLPEVVIPGVTGILVPPADTLALQNSLQELLGDPVKRADLGHSARAFVVSKYTWVHVARETLQLYDLAAGKPRQTTDDRGAA